MDSSSTTFFGKCITVLIGIGLSWITLTNPDVDSLAARLIQAEVIPPSDAGPAGSQDGPIVDSINDPVDASSPTFAQRKAQAFPVAQAHFVAEASAQGGPSTLVASPSDRAESMKIEAISTELKRLGASYLLLEKLPQKSGTQYRVRCDLADQHTDVRCCFEVIRTTPLAAMEEVLRVARQNAGLAQTSPGQSGSHPDAKSDESIRAVATSS